MRCKYLVAYFEESRTRSRVNMSATIWTTVALLAMLAAVGSGSNEGKNPFISEQEAHSFVGNHRSKRGLWQCLFSSIEEECAHEGCSFEEVLECRSTSESREYLMTLACRLWPCSTGYRCQGVIRDPMGSGSHWRTCNPVCFGSTSCPHGGHCGRPNYCSGCERGYESPRCSDVNECVERRICDDHATCANTDGSYTCRCAPGYVGDGHTCTGKYLYLWPFFESTPKITTTAKSTTSTTTTRQQTTSTQTSSTTTTTTAKPTTSVPTTVGKAPSTEMAAVVQVTGSVRTSSQEMTHKTTEEPEVQAGAAELSDVCGDDGQQPCGKPPMLPVEKTMLIIGTVAFAFACGIAFLIFHRKLKKVTFLPPWLVGRRQEDPPPPYSESNVNVITVATKVVLPPDIKISTTDKDGPPPGNEISNELPPGKEIPDDPVKILPPQEADVTDIEFILKSNALQEKSPMN
ncbi:NID2 [Branchiostoma lanceolatum]|uniref:NID2 protein n=1 Tax=Branchiostoma lanceolatum TaxID=7740 RepID=A0A8J9ZAI0_BRALA|nr:NID2 [Branchiostoma lanceolatum]